MARAAPRWCSRHATARCACGNGASTLPVEARAWTSTAFHRRAGSSMHSRPDRPARVALLLAATLAFWSGPSQADIDIDVQGVGEAERNNVLIFLSLARYRERDDLNQDQIDRLHDRVD